MKHLLLSALAASMVVLAIGPRTASAQEDQDFLKQFAREIEQ